MNSIHTHYENLKVARDAPPEVIRAAYKALSQRYHPDKNDSPDAPRIMRILNDAYGVLSDPEQRAAYDRSLDGTDREQVAPEPEDRAGPFFHPEPPAASVPPQAAPVHPALFPMAGRWKRWFARLFDLWWETIAVALIGSPLLAKYSSGYVALVNDAGGAMLAAILFLPAALILDAIIYRLTGNTPGKALLGARVETMDGCKLTFQEYLGRNFSMWMRGLAFGIPIASLVTMGTQSGRLGKGEQASYDADSGFRVRTAKTGIVRAFVFAVAFVVLLLAQAGLKSRDEDINRVIQSQTAAADYTWANPITQATVTVPRQWKSNVQTTKDGETVCMFTEASNHALLIMGREIAQGWAMRDYAQAFTTSVAKTMVLDQGTLSSDSNSWQADGKLTEQDLRVHVEVRRSGSAFWRIVTLQDQPYAYTDQMVATLREGLWATAW